MKSIGIFNSIDDLEEFVSKEYPNDIFKYEPFVGIVPGVPVIEEEGQGAAEGGKIPGRKDLTEEDYKTNRPMDENQKPIKETSKPLISPAVVSKNDLSGFPARPEENIPAKDPVVPIKVRDNYMMDDQPEEQRPIIGKSIKTEDEAKKFIKDFPNMDEGTAIGELNENSEGEEKIGESSPPIDPDDSIIQKASRSNLIPVMTVVKYHSGMVRPAIRWKSAQSLGIKEIESDKPLIGIISIQQSPAFTRVSRIKQTMFYLAETDSIKKLYNNEYLPLDDSERYGRGLYLYNNLDRAKEANKYQDEILPVKVMIRNPYILATGDIWTPEFKGKLSNFGYDSVYINTGKPLVFDIFVFDSRFIKVIKQESRFEKAISGEYAIDKKVLKMLQCELMNDDDDDSDEEDVISKAIIQTPMGDDGNVDYDKVPKGQSIWVTVKNPSSPLVGRPILLTKRPDGLFALTGGAGFKQLKDKYGIKSDPEALRHLVVSGKPQRSERDKELENIADKAKKVNEPLIEKKRELMAYGKEELDKVYEDLNQSMGTETKLTAIEMKKQRGDFVDKASKAGLSEEEAQNYATNIIRHLAANERTVVERRRREVEVKLFSRLREMKDATPEEAEQNLESLNEELGEFRSVKVSLPNPGQFKGVSKEQMDGKIGDMINEQVSESLNPNPLDDIIDDELKQEGTTPEGESENIEIEVGAGIKPFEINDQESFNSSVEKIKNYYKIKNEINEVKRMIKPKNFSRVTPEFLEQMRMEVKGTFPEATDEEIVEMQNSYEEQYQKNNSAISFYTALGDFWNDKTSLTEKLSRADNSFGGYVNSGATSSLAALTGKYFGQRVETGSLIDKTNVETAALIAAFNFRDSLKGNLSQYNKVISDMTEFNSKNQIATERQALSRHQELKDKYATIQSEKAAGTLTSKTFLVEAEINNLIEQKKNLGAALGSMQASAALLEALTRARDAKDTEVSLDFGSDRAGAEMRLEELRLGNKGYLDNSNPSNIRIVTSTRALNRFERSQDVIKENYDNNESIKSNMEGTFKDDAGRIYVKDYNVPGWKDKVIDSDGNEFEHHFRVEQRNDIEFLKSIDEASGGKGGGVISRTMGAGKTNTALGFFANKISKDKDYSALTVVPKGRVKQWIDEAKRFTNLDVVEIPEGTNKEERAKAIANIKPGQIAVMSHRDAVFSYNTLEGASNSGLFKGICIDEPQELTARSSNGNMAAAVRKLTKLPVDNRLALTATPARDNLTEAYDLVNWVSHKDKSLGPRTRFQRIYGGYGSGTNAQDVTLQQMIFKEIAPYISGDKLTAPNFKVKHNDVIISKTEAQNKNMRALELNVDKLINSERDKYIQDILNDPDELNKWNSRYGRTWQNQARAKATKIAKDNILKNHSDNLEGIFGDMRWSDNPKILKTVENIRDNSKEKHVLFIDNPSQRRALIQGLQENGFKLDQIKNIAATATSGSIAGKEMSKRVMDFRKNKNIKVLFVDKQSASGYNLQEGNTLHVVGTPTDAAQYVQVQGRLARMPRVGDVTVRTYKYSDVPFEDIKWLKMEQQLKILRAVAPSSII